MWQSAVRQRPFAQTGGCHTLSLQRPPYSAPLSLIR
jgi:hypothetical protein